MLSINQSDLKFSNPTKCTKNAIFVQKIENIAKSFASRMVIFLCSLVQPNHFGVATDRRKSPKSATRTRDATLAIIASPDTTKKGS